MHNLNQNSNRLTSLNHPEAIGLLFLGYFLMNSLIHILVSGVAELDQTEVILAAQYFELGYGTQPPLYNWISWTLFEFTGPSLFTLLGLKSIILAGTVYAVLKTGERLEFTPTQIWITALGLTMIPAFIWESQRDLTHSTLSALMAAWLIFQTLKTTQSPTITNYAWLGVICALGFLSKYNFAILIIAILVALLSSASHRKALFSYKFLITLFIALLVSSPHLSWMAEHFATASKGIDKLEMDGNPFTGLLSFIISSIAFLTPLWIVALLIFTKPKTLFSMPSKQPDANLLKRLLLAIVAIIIAVLFITESQHFKDRWLLPLLIFTPLFVALQATENPIKLKRFFFTAGTILVLITLLLPLRILGVKYLNTPDERAAIPYPELSTEFLQQFATIDTILTDEKLAGGNFKLAYPNADLQLLYQPYPKAFDFGKSVLILCEKPDCLLRQNAHNTQQIHSKLKLEKLTTYLDKAQTRPYTIYWKVLDYPYEKRD